MNTGSQGELAKFVRRCGLIPSNDRNVGAAFGPAHDWTASLVD